MKVVDMEGIIIVVQVKKSKMKLVTNKVTSGIIHGIIVLHNSYISSIFYKF